VIDAICGLFGHGRAVWSFSRSDPGSLHCRDLYGWKLHFARRDVGTKATVTVDHTGCDSLYSTAADTSTAYFGGSGTCAGVYGYAGICFLPYSN
jgi:hypothetical protein